MAQSHIIYEQPLNERIRMFLRLEHLFRQVEYEIEGESAWHSRAALNGLLDIYSIFARADLKAEITAELERQTTVLARLEDNPNIDGEQLGRLLAELEVLIDRLHALPNQVGQSLRDSELLSSVRQRNSIPGGSCDFDLPAFHYWLSQSAALRILDLKSWFATFDAINLAVMHVLRILRDGAVPVSKVAKGGLFKLTLDGASAYQLVRVTVAKDEHCYVEISGGKHRASIRFMTYNADGSVAPLMNDIEFLLSCCVI